MIGGNDTMYYIRKNIGVLWIRYEAGLRPPSASMSVYLSNE